MKTVTRICVLGGLAVLTLAGIFAFGQPKGPKVTVKGEVVDLWCYLEGGDHGEKHRECATNCAKAGNPLGIVDAKGNVYVAMGLQDHQPGRDVLLDKVAQTVTVTGTLVKKGGTQLLYITSIK
ncbi:MAG TPA: hypothetical protein VKE24_15450 [Candidatus Acidoferrales bacterium]|nr:hypothetical protein [Candidatus Acidoferrales bacterium]